MKLNMNDRAFTHTNVIESGTEHNWLEWLKAWLPVPDRNNEPFWIRTLVWISRIDGPGIHGERPVIAEIQ